MEGQTDPLKVPASRSKNKILLPILFGITGIIFGFIVALNSLDKATTITMVLLSSVLIASAAALLSPTNNWWQNMLVFGGAFVSAIAIIIPITDTVRAAPDSQASPESCFKKADQNLIEKVRFSEALYCQTRFANIWHNESPARLQSNPVMLEDNKRLIEDNYSRILSSGGADSFLPATTEDMSGQNIGGKIPYVFSRWPQYESRPFGVVGNVLSVDQLSGDTGPSEWVYQIGSLRDGNKVIYLLLLKPEGWRPPPSETCEIALTEVIPVARGMAVRQESGGPLDTIYGVGTAFSCLPRMKEEDFDAFRSSLSPEERAVFDEGASRD